MSGSNILSAYWAAVEFSRSLSTACMTHYILSEPWFIATYLKASTQHAAVIESIGLSPIAAVATATADFIHNKLYLSVAVWASYTAITVTAAINSAVEIHPTTRLSWRTCKRASFIQPDW
jgi:hypothetical protein